MTYKDIGKQRAAQRRHYEKNKEWFRDRDRQKYELKRALIIESKNKPCADCGLEYPPYVMDFDHRPDEEKLFNISTNGNKSVERVRQEIEKCDVVCANCHRERTHQRLMAI